MEFRSSYGDRDSKSRPYRDFEVNGGEQVTETAGYIPKNLMIRQMVLAGERLDDWRDQVYDFKPGEPVNPDFIDPTRSPNFDWADASMLLRIAQRNARLFAEEVKNGSVPGTSEKVSESEGVSESGEASEGKSSET